MVDTIRPHDDAHEKVQLLLPWYVNGTLDHDDVAAIESHLPDCAECRADLELERALGRELVRLASGEARGWPARRERPAGRPSRGAAPRIAPRAILRKPVFRKQGPMRWAVAAQVASLALAVGLLGAAVFHPHPRPGYVALGARPTERTGNVIVMFKPTTTEADLRGALLRSGARLTDGPTAGNAYLLHVAQGQRGTALTLLKSDQHVVLAEPIDQPGQP